MSSIRNRGEIASPMDKVNLTVAFRDQNGNYIDTDSFPKISIIQPSGGILLAPTSVGVTRLAQGKYGFTFTAPYVGPYGAWADVWVGFINGQRIETTFNFIIASTQMPVAPNSDGFMALGDDVGFDYSQNAIKNINILLKMLKARLNSSGKVLAKDQYGNDIYVDCDIYSVDMLVSLLAMSLSLWNGVPYFTYFSFDDNAFVAQWGASIVDGAAISSLAAMSLLQKGSEVSVNDNGISFQLPGVSDLMNSQYSAMFSAHTEAVKYIKNSLRPAPLGLGTWSATSGRNPAYTRLRHRRSGKIF